MHGQQNFKVKLSWHRNEIGWEHVEWIHLTQDRVKWQALVVRGNELSSFIKCGEFLGLLWTCWLLKKDLALWSYLFRILVSTGD